MTSDRDLPCNFLEYLEWRLEQQTDATMRLLGEWLTSYKPLRKCGRSDLSGAHEAFATEQNLDEAVGGECSFAS